MAITCIAISGGRRSRCDRSRKLILWCLWKRTVISTRCFSRDSKILIVAELFADQRTASICIAIAQCTRDFQWRFLEKIIYLLTWKFIFYIFWSYDPENFRIISMSKVNLEQIVLIRILIWTFKLELFNFKSVGDRVQNFWNWIIFQFSLNKNDDPGNLFQIDPRALHPKSSWKIAQKRNGRPWEYARSPFSRIHEWTSVCNRITHGRWTAITWAKINIFDPVKSIIC